MSKSKWRVGDRGYEVEWCHFRYVDPEDQNTGDPDLDRHSVACFRTREDAMTYAKQVYPEDKYGSVRITPFEVVPHHEDYPEGPAMREYAGDTEYYEGED